MLACFVRIGLADNGLTMFANEKLEMLYAHLQQPQCHLI